MSAGAVSRLVSLEPSAAAMLLDQQAEHDTVLMVFCVCMPCTALSRALVCLSLTMLSTES